MNQKVLFQIEKRILENKIKKRQDNITDLEIQNHKFKEEVRNIKIWIVISLFIKIFSKLAILSFNFGTVSSLFILALFFIF